ncbi:MAG TPA: HipA domain-containing protein [Gammaproteobacteria bacterium]|nr:HipA domain-containing protein [Gammaproteobacteria bacterium]
MKSNNTQKINTLIVRLQDRLVGVINRLAGDRHIFSFEQDYIDDPDRPTLSLSFKGRANGLVTSSRIVNLRLPPFFSNLLPEGHLRTYLAQRAGVKPEQEFFLLAALGADLPGALTVTPLETNEYISESHPVDDSNHRNDTVLRFSLAGIQLKFSAIMEASGGLTIPADGMNGSWIVKLPSARFPTVPENEFVMLALARAIGIALPQNQLIHIREIRGLPKDTAKIEGKALAVERFDRSANGQRVHMEDFAQVFGLFPENKYNHRSYANIAAVLWAEMGETGIFEFVRRLIFAVLIGNADMHLKNWSILYPDGRTPVLSPAYDLVATLPYIPGDRLALNFGGSRSLSEVNPNQIRRFADTARLPASSISQLVMETVECTVTAWKTLEQKELLSGDMKKAIDQQIQTVATNTQNLFL